MIDAKHKDDVNGSPTSRKRTIGEAVRKHPANKRKRIGLSSIPDSVKAQVFERIPDQLKTELFNSIALAAFPDFDNLIMAAWNVVSVYDHVGTDSPELHHSVTELKSILREFDSVYRKERGAERVAKENPDVKDELLQTSTADDGLDSSRNEIDRDEEQAVIQNGEYAHTHRPSSRDTNAHSTSSRSTPIDPQKTPNGIGRENGHPLPSPRMTQNMPPNVAFVEDMKRHEKTEQERRRRARDAHMRDMQEEERMMVDDQEANMNEHIITRSNRGRGEPVQSSPKMRSSQFDRNGTRPNKISPEEQQNFGPAHPFSTKNKAHDGRPPANNRSSQMWSYPEEMFEMHGRPPVNLGNSKLRPKSSGNAPEAPMMHTVHNSKKDSNGSRQP